MYVRLDGDVLGELWLYAIHLMNTYLFHPYRHASFTTSCATFEVPAVCASKLASF